MKSTIKENDKVAYSYPLLMKGNNSGNVVLMTSDCNGVVVYLGDTPLGWQLGQSSNDWDIDNFKPFNGQVVLEN